MKKFRSFATSLTTATFIIVGISGVMLFFNMKSLGAKLIHEYIGLAMMAVCVMHIVANFGSFKGYLRGIKFASIALIVALCVGAGVMINLNDKSGGKPPIKEIAKALSAKTPAQICEFTNRDCAKIDALIAQKNANKNASLKEISAQTQLSETKLLNAIFKSEK